MLTQVWGSRRLRQYLGFFLEFTSLLLTITAAIINGEYLNNYVYMNKYIYMYIHIHIYVYLKYKYIIYINVCVCTRANNKWPCLWSFYKFLTISNWTEAYIWVHSMGRSPSPQHNPKFNEQKHPHRLSFRGKRIALFIVKLRFVYDV